MSVAKPDYDNIGYNKVGIRETVVNKFAEEYRKRLIYINRYSGSGAFHLAYSITAANKMHNMSWFSVKKEFHSVSSSCP